MTDFEILLFMVILFAALMFFGGKTGVGLFHLAAIGPVIYMTFTISHPFFYAIAILIIVAIFYHVFTRVIKQTD
jgi:hypothetical protein